MQMWTQDKDSTSPIIKQNSGSGVTSLEEEDRSECLTAEHLPPDSPCMLTYISENCNGATLGGAL